MYAVGSVLTEGRKNAPSVGSVFHVEEYDDALEVAVRLVHEQSLSGEGVPEYSREEIIEELSEDGDFADPDGGWSVFINELTAQTEESIAADRQYNADVELLWKLHKE